jgi:nitrite reductase/ring-hydroxylating ferredoxin subunit
MASCSRREFAALALAGAGSLLLGCNGVTPNGTVTPAMGQATLTFAQFPMLAAAGGSAVVDVTGSFPLVVVRVSDTDATALSATCTHAGCLVGYSPAPMLVHCPCHDANFGLDGSVKSGPTQIPLPVYKAQILPDGIVVDLS